MTLKKLKAIAIVIPIAAVLVLELARYLMVGAVSWEKRLALDLVFVAAIVVFAAVIFRYVEEMQDRLQRQNSELLALHDAALDVTADLSLDIVLNRVVEQARLLVGAKYGALSVVDRDNRIVSFITSGIDDAIRQRIGPPPVGHGLLGIVLHQGHHLNLRDLTRHPESVGFPAHHPPMRTLLAVPVPCKGPFVGNLYLTEKLEAAQFSPDDEESLVRFALQAALAIDNAHLHAQVGDLAVAQERLRIAHEMHDGLAQVLGYVNTKVQAAEAYLRKENTEAAAGQLKELANAARQAYADVRESIVGLRTLPGPANSFADVLREYVARWEEMSGVAASLEIAPAVQFAPTQELQVIRIVQESLTNVRKHARASHATIAISREEGLLIATVTDDGSGFNASGRARGEFPQFGLSTMRERAESIGGSLTIESAAGAGTTVRLELPVRTTAA